MLHLYNMEYVGTDNRWVLCTETLSGEICADGVDLMMSRVRNAVSMVISNTCYLLTIK